MNSHLIITLFGVLVTLFGAWYIYKLEKYIPNNETKKN